MAIHTGENEQALRKILDMTRLIGIVVLVAHFYNYCYAAFHLWGLSRAFSDQLMGNIHNTGLFANFHKSKFIALGFLLISLLGAKGRKAILPGCKTPFVNLTGENAFYYFSCEGAPNGKFDTTTNYLFRPDLGKRHFLGNSTEETDIKALPSESCKWCYFGDEKTQKAFFFIHYVDDVILDFYRPLGEMTVFGFGRTGNANENLTDVPQNFTIGFSADTA